MSLVVSFDKELTELLKVKEKASDGVKFGTNTINITIFDPPQPSSHSFMASLTQF